MKKVKVYWKKVGGIQLLEKAVQSVIYEKALKNHYIEILYIDFEDTGKCIKLHQDTTLLNGENIFPKSDEQMFDEYICKKIMHHVMILFLLHGALQI